MKTFNPSFLTQIQNQDWTCSIRSVMMLLDSIGIAVTPDEAQDAMSPRYVMPAVGLLDASGAGIVEVLKTHWGVEARNDGGATFDEVANQAGRAPVAIGLRNWGGPNKGHWSAVRGFDGERLILANPGGTGPVYGQQTLDRQQFDARGPASMVVIPLADTVDDGAGAPTPLPVGQMPRGIDVASYQGHPDWATVAASGIAFAFTKVTEDDDYQNPTFVSNWTGIKAAGLIRGAYHFARPDDATDAIEEADYFLGRLESVGGVQDGDILALDMESGTGDLGQWTLDWLHRVEQRTGVKPMVYTGAWFSDPHELDLQPELVEYGLWLASYQERMPAPPAPWKQVAIWQHSERGQVAGIAGNVDLNLFNGTLDQLRAYGQGGGQPVGVPDVTPADELGSLRNLVGNSFHEDGVVIPALDGALRNHDWGQVEAVVKWLRENNPHKAA